VTIIRARDPEYGYSYNGLVKIDYQINSKNTLSFHLFAGQGNQVAPVGGSALSEAASELKYYYEVAPIHVSNYALVLEFGDHDTLVQTRCLRALITSGKSSMTLTAVCGVQVRAAVGAKL